MPVTCHFHTISGWDQVLVISELYNNKELYFLIDFVPAPHVIMSPLTLMIDATEQEKSVATLHWNNMNGMQEHNKNICGKKSNRWWNSEVVYEWTHLLNQDAF